MAILETKFLPRASLQDLSPSLPPIHRKEGLHTQLAHREVVTLSLCIRADCVGAIHTIQACWFSAFNCFTECAVVKGAHNVKLSLCFLVLHLLSELITLVRELREEQNT